MIGILQQQNGFTSSTVSSYGLSFNNPVTPGSTLYVYSFYTYESGATQSLADSVNGSYGSALDAVHSVAGTQVNSHWAFSNTGSGTPTVTLTMSESITGMGLWLVEVGSTSGYAGVHNANDQIDPGTGANAVTSGSMTPPSQPGLIIAQANEVVGSAGYSVGTSVAFTSAGTGWGGQALLEYFRYTTTAALAGTFTDSNGASGESVTLAACFTEAVSGTATLAWIS